MTATQTQIRRDSSTNLDAATPATGELGYDTTNKGLRLGDGSTAGGIRVPNSIMLQNQAYVYASAGGTADALTLTLSPAPTAYTAGMKISFKATADNTTTTSTINVNALGAKTLKKKGASGVSAIAAGDIQDGCIYDAIYDGTYFQLQDPASATGGVVDTQTFTGSGTWTKPSQGTLAIIRLWGAGGSGSSRSTTGSAGGGGGGAFTEIIVPLASLGSTETVTIGAGGAGVSGNTQGNNGGNSTFGSWATAYGGGGGTSGSSSASNGGGGGGAVSAGGQTTYQTTNVCGGGKPYENFHVDTIAGSYQGQDKYVYGGGHGGKTGSYDGYDSVYGGGGGGGGGASSGATTGGGDSDYGGGGGGGCSSATGGTRTGGTSLFGGNGGDGGANTGGNGTAGTQPAGGGGGAVQGGTSGAGAAGKCVVYVI